MKWWENFHKKKINENLTDEINMGSCNQIKLTNILSLIKFFFSILYPLLSTEGFH